jgi:hypothetical protein
LRARLLLRRWRRLHRRRNQTAEQWKVAPGPIAQMVQLTSPGEERQGRATDRRGRQPGPDQGQL